MIKDKSQIACLIYLGIMGASLFFLLPLLVGGLSAKMPALSGRQLGFFASSDLTGLCLASLSAYFWIRTANWKVAAIIGIALIVIGNFISVSTIDFNTLIIWRLIAGLGQGILMSISFAGLNDTENPDGYIGFVITGGTLIAALSFLFFDFLSQWGGLNSLFIIMGTIALIGLIPVFLILPIQNERPDLKEKIAKTKNKYAIPAALCLVGLFLSFFGNAGVWAFVERIGNEVGFSLEFMSKALAISLFVSLIGSMIPYWLELKWGRFFPILLGVFFNIAAILVVFNTTSEAVYTISSAIYLLALNFLTPYIIGAIGSYDTIGKIMVLVAPTYSVANAIGPVSLGLMVGDAGYTTIAMVGIGIIMLSLLVISWSLLKYKSMY